jgi:transmembrane sensor
MNAAKPISADIARLREASGWVQQLSEAHDQHLVDRWMAWCAADPRNVHAFESMQDVWDGFAGANPLVLPAARAANPFSKPWGWLSVAAGVLLLVGIGAWFEGRYPTAQDFHTSPGEQRSEILADGSRLDLAPDSEVRVRLAPFRREVQLQRGQAFFAVSHSLLRAFVVRAQDLTVTAAGTAFDVRTGPRGTIVTVIEGSVHVTPGSAYPGLHSRAVLAGVGQRVTFSMKSRGLSMATVDPVAAESWRQGVLPFVGEPLEDVVGEINRYSARKIDIAPGFSQTRFTGTVSLGHVEDWLHALPQIFSVEVIDRGSNDIHIQSRAFHDVG